MRTTGRRIFQISGGDRGVGDLVGWTTDDQISNGNLGVGTWGADGRRRSRPNQRCGQRGDEGGRRHVIEERGQKGVAEEETQGESGRGSADRGQGGGVAIQGT